MKGWDSIWRGGGTKEGRDKKKKRINPLFQMKKGERFRLIKKPAYYFPLYQDKYIQTPKPKKKRILISPHFLPQIF